MRDRLFTCLSIETSSKCNRHCAFCPVSVAPREDELMPMEMIEKIVADLVRLEYKQRIVLHSYNEPTRDDRLCDILKMIRERLPQTSIMFNTNGDYFKTADDIIKYFVAGLNQMQINVYSASDGSGNPDRVASGIKNAERRYDALKAMVDSIHWLDQEGTIYQKVSPHAKNVSVEKKWGIQPTASHDNAVVSKKHKSSKRNHLSNRAGNIPDFVPAVEEPLGKMCVRPFREMIINWRGESILCCNDYHAQASSGNVMERPIEDLFFDERYETYRIKLLAKDRHIHLCDVCDYDGGFYQHNVKRVTRGPEEDLRVVNADMRLPEHAGFAPKLVQIGRRS